MHTDYYPRKGKVKLKDSLQESLTFFFGDNFL